MTTVRALMLVIVTSLVAHAAQTGPQCQSAQLKAASRRASKELACYAAAARKAAFVDPDCVDKVVQKFTDDYQKLSDKGGCFRTNAAATIAQSIDQMLATVAKFTGPCGASGDFCNVGSDCCSNSCIMLGPPFFPFCS